MARPKKVKPPEETGGRAASLANLLPYANKPYRKRDNHGCYSIDISQPATRKLAEQIHEELIQDGITCLRASDTINLQMLATCLRQIRRAEEYLDGVGRGITNNRGEVRPVFDVFFRALREAQGLCESLGLSPRNRAHLGVEIARGLSLSKELEKGEDSLKEILKKNPEVLNQLRNFIYKDEESEQPKRFTRHNK